MLTFFCRRDSTHHDAGRSRVRAALQDGFTIIEVLVAAVVLAIGLTGVLSLLNTDVKRSYETRAREGATSLAREILEDAQTLPFGQISPNSIVGELQAMNGLANVSGGATWKIQRRGVTYTVAVSECAIDDPKDGYGKHENTFKENPFCGESSTEGTADTQPEDFKRVTAEVSWTALGRTPHVHQVLTLTAAGEAPGLTASELKLISPKVSAPTAPVVVSQPSEDKLTFSVQAPSGTNAMNWALDGSKQSNQPTLVKGTEWQFTWSVPLPSVSDGTYQVAAQAIDATGVEGPPVSISVTLIRSTPAAPKVVYGGFNEVLSGGVAKKVAELEWQANSERNVIGYRVRNASGALVCPESEATLSLAHTCTDFNPPSPTGSAASLTYSVYALYRKATGEALSEEVSQGPAGTFTLEKGPPPGPGAPENLKLEKNAEGSVVLKWSAPKSGPAVIFYRVYRGSRNYTDRYGVTSAATTEFTDTDAVTTHSYWVTAVSATLTESPFLGPVTG